MSNQDIVWKDITEDILTAFYHTASLFITSIGAIWKSITFSCYIYFFAIVTFPFFNCIRYKILINILLLHSTFLFPDVNEISVDIKISNLHVKNWSIRLKWKENNLTNRFCAQCPLIKIYVSVSAPGSFDSSTWGSIGVCKYTI